MTPFLPGSLGASQPTPQLHSACTWKIVTNRGRLIPGKQKGFGFISLIFLLCIFSMIISSWEGTEKLCA